MCVSCDLLPRLSSSSLPLLIPRDRRHPPLVLCFAQSRTSSFLVPRFILHRRWWLHARVCTRVRCTLSADLLFLSLFGGGLHRESLVTQAERDIPSTFLAMSHYSFVATPCAPSHSFVGRIPSMFLPLPLPRSPRPSGFNFVHFSFLNYSVVSSIRRRRSVGFCFFFGGVCFSANQINPDGPDFPSRAFRISRRRN